MLDGRHVPNSPLPSAISCRGPHWRCGSPEFLTFPSRGHLENEPRLHHRVFFLKKPMQLSEPGLLPDFVLESDYGIGLRRRRLRRRSEEHTSELQSRVELVCRLLLEK